MAKKNTKKEEFKNEDDSVILMSNEKLLASRAYIVCTVDNVQGGHTFTADLSKLNRLEVHGFLKIVQEQIGGLWNGIEDAELPDEEDEEEED